MNIGFVGPKHSGKTTASKVLVDALDYTRLALADPLKNAAVNAMNSINADLGIPIIVNRTYLDDHKDEVFVPFLQWLGTEYGREFFGTPRRWIDMFLDHASRFAPVVCDDVRYVNEGDALREAGFTLIRIQRDETMRQASLRAAGVNPDTMSHKSETELSQIRCDYTIYASSGPASLKWDVLKLVEALLDKDDKTAYTVREAFRTPVTMS